jgi:hypothetical protein
LVLLLAKHVGFMLTVHHQNRETRTNQASERTRLSQYFMQKSIMIECCRYGL